MKKLLNTLFVTTQGAYLCHEGEAVLVRVDKETKLRLALSLVDLRQVQGRGFKKTESGAVTMDDDTRKALLVAYQKRKQEEIQHPFLDETVQVGLLLHVQAMLLAASGFGVAAGNIWQAYGFPHARGDGPLPEVRTLSPLHCTCSTVVLAFMPQLGHLPTTCSRWL